MVMDEIVEAFVQAPSEALLDGSTRDQLVKIAAHYKVDVGDKRVKETVKANLKLKLSKMNVLSAGEAASVSAGNEGATQPLGVGLDAGLSFEQQKELLVLRMQLETEKEVAVERVRQSIEMEKVVSVEKVRQETEQAKIELEMRKLALVGEDKVMFPHGPSGPGGSPVRSDLSELKLVPQFNERDPETFFSLFERLAKARGWSESTMTLMLQCVLTGKAQKAYSCLSSSDSVKYDVVKTAVLKVYELVPEAHRQRFRGWRRGDKSHLEFARDLSTQFDRWCTAAEIESYDDLRDLMILEQFKNSVPGRIATYINERKVKTAAEAAALADDYLLIHGGEIWYPGARGDDAHSENCSTGSAWSSRPGRNIWMDQRHERGFREADKLCNYCHKRGHWKRDCYIFKARSKTGVEGSPKPAMCVGPVLDQVLETLSESEPRVVGPDMQSYLPFISDGCVSLVGSDEKVNVKILRDTTCT